MSSRTVIAILKANILLGVWIKFALWIGVIIFAVHGRTLEWEYIAVFLPTVAIIQAVAEFSNTYADRDEDWLYKPTNPLVTGELDVATARKAFVLQNVVVALLLIALLLVTRNGYLIIAMVAGWFIALEYSLPPLRFKETVLCPFFLALGEGLLPIVAWLVVAPLDRFIVAFAAFWFVYSFGFAITTKFRKTFLAFNSGRIPVGQDGSVHNVGTVGLTLRVKTAMVLEGAMTFGAFMLVSVFWHLDIFDNSLSIALLTLPLALTIVAIVMRLKDPLRNDPKCQLFMALAWMSILLSFFAVALASVIHWGFAVLACIVLVIGSALLLRTIHPFEIKALPTRRRRQGPLGLS